MLLLFWSEANAASEKARWKSLLCTVRIQNFRSCYGLLTYSWELLVAMVILLQAWQAHPQLVIIISLAMHCLHSHLDSYITTHHVITVAISTACKRVSCKDSLFTVSGLLIILWSSKCTVTYLLEQVGLLPTYMWYAESIPRINSLSHKFEDPEPTKCTDTIL